MGEGLKGQTDMESSRTERNPADTESSRTERNQADADSGRTERNPEDTDSSPAGFYEEVREYFDLKGADLRTYSPLTLAFIGDAVYELVVRSILVGRGNEKTNKLHAHASHLERAAAQAGMIDGMMSEMTAEEQDYYRRGKNAKPPTMPKNASPEDYHNATGFETLMGYLYLSGQTERMLELIRIGLFAIEAPEAGG